MLVQFRNLVPEKLRYQYAKWQPLKSTTSLIAIIRAYSMRCFLLKNITLKSSKTFGSLRKFS